MTGLVVMRSDRDLSAALAGLGLDGLTMLAYPRSRLPVRCLGAG